MFVMYAISIPVKGVGAHIDDEYAWAGVEDPKIMITTSHSPSSRLKQFAKVINKGRPFEIKVVLIIMILIINVLRKSNWYSRIANG